MASDFKIAFQLTAGWEMAMVAKSWIGSASTDWETAGNWGPSGVPGSGDDVTIGTTGNSPALNTSISVRSLTINGNDTLTLAAASLATTNGITLSAGGGISGTGTVGTVTGSGASYITASGGLLDVSSVTDNSNALTLTIAGSSDSLRLDAASRVNTVSFNSSSGTLILPSTLTVAAQMAIGAGTLWLDQPGAALSDLSGVTLGSGGKIIGQGQVTGGISGPGAVIANGLFALELVSPIGASDNTAFEIADGLFCALLLDAAPGPGNTFTFLGPSGTLRLANDAGFNGTISGLNVTSSAFGRNSVDIEGHTVTITGVTGQGTTSGTLSLSDGAVLHLTNLSSPLWGANAVGDGAGGTDIFVAPLNPFANLAWNIALTADFNNDGKSDLVWRRASDGLVEIQFFSGNSAIGGGAIANSPFDASWNITGKGDFNGDGHIDLIWQRISDGLPEIQLLNGNTGIGGGTIVNNVFDSSWVIFGSGDFDGDHKTDLVWKRKSDGLLEIQLLNGNVNAGGGVISNNPFDSTWHIFGSGDFNGDGKSDLIWQRSSDGLLEIQFLNGNINAGGGVITNNPFDASWSLFGTGDFNGDGKADLVWRRNSDGLVEIQFLSGNTAIGGGTIVNNPFDSSWAVAGVGDFNGDGKSDLIWRRISDGLTEIQFLNGNNAIGGGLAATSMGDSPFFPTSPPPGSGTAVAAPGGQDASQLIQAISSLPSDPPGALGGSANPALPNDPSNQLLAPPGCASAASAFHL